MWKYHCKTHFLLISIAFVLGIALMAVTYDTSMALYGELVTEIAKDYPDLQAFGFFEFLKNNAILLYISSGLSIAGIANACLLIQYVMRNFKFGPFLLLACLFLAPTAIITAGVLLVVPSLVVSLIGWILLNSDIKKQLRDAGFESEKAIFEYYKSKYSLDESIKDMAQKCKKNIYIMDAVYLLGIVAIITIMTFVTNMIVLVVAFFFYSFAFSLFMRYRAACTIPITSILYNECDPGKCISAIYYFSTYPFGFRLSNHTLMAWALIYMNDPKLAKAVLIPYQRKDAASLLSYLSLMAYIHYLQKDEEALNEVAKEVEKVHLSYGKTGVFIQNEEVNAIQNKVKLMNGELNVCKKYYLQTLQKAKFPYQQVDACYYIALISFVEQDYVIAKMYFDKVVKMGNKICYVDKAKYYLSKIEALNLQKEEAE